MTLTTNVFALTPPLLTGNKDFQEEFKQVYEKARSELRHDDPDSRIRTIENLIHEIYLVRLTNIKGHQQLEHMMERLDDASDIILDMEMFIL